MNFVLDWITFEHDFIIFTQEPKWTHLFQKNGCKLSVDKETGVVNIYLNSCGVTPLVLRTRSVTPHDTLT